MLLRVQLHVAPGTNADQVTARQGKVWTILKMLDVMDSVGLRDAAIALASLAAITVAPKDHVSLMDPFLGAVKIFYFHSLIIIREV